MVASDAQYLGFVVKAEEEGEEVTINIYKKLIAFVLVGLIPRDLFLHFVPSPPYLEELLPYGSQSQAVCQRGRGCQGNQAAEQKCCSITLRLEYM